MILNAAPPNPAAAAGGLTGRAPVRWLAASRLISKRIAFNVRIARG